MIPVPQGHRAIQRNEDLLYLSVARRKKAAAIPLIKFKHLNGAEVHFFDLPASVLPKFGAAGTGGNDIGPDIWRLGIGCQRAPGVLGSHSEPISMHFCALAKLLRRKQGS